MKKLVMLAVVAAMSVMMLTGCGSTENQESTAAAETVEETEEAETAAVSETQKTYSEDAYLSNLTAADYVTLGEYVGMEIEMTPVSVTDEQVEAQIQSNLANNVSNVEITEDRAAQNGDIANIDFEGKKDGVAFEGGTSAGYDLLLGSGSFIDGFEDGVVGMKKGETKDLELTFPENYGSADLAGQDVVFTVTLNGIYEEVVPELNDEFVQSLAIEGCDTVEAYREYVYNDLLASAQEAYNAEAETKVIEALIEKCSFENIPEAMIERYYDGLYNKLSYQAYYLGTDLDTLMEAWYGWDQETYTAEMKSLAEKSAQQILMMQVIAENEGLTLTEEEIKAAVEEEAVAYGYEGYDAYVEAMGGEDSLKGYDEYLLAAKVSEFLMNNTVLIDAEDVTEETETVEE